MNLFVTHYLPPTAATHLDDIRLRKMLLETAQMLCTELTRRGHTMPYRPTHSHHPVVLALRDDATLEWTIRYFTALDTEYRFRFDKPHKSYLDCADLILPHSPPRGFPIFANCARRADLNLNFTHLPVFFAYRQYLSARWNRDNSPPQWTNRRSPEWFLRRRV